MEGNRVIYRAVESAHDNAVLQCIASNVHGSILANAALKVMGLCRLIPFTAKFHYAFLVADRSEPGRRPAASWNLTYHALSSSLVASWQVCDRSVTNLGPVCDQDSIMEFAKKYYYFDTTNIFTFTFRSLSKNFIRRSLCNPLPVLATILMRRVKKSVVLVTFLPRRITIVARTGRGIEQTFSDEGL